MSKLIFTKKAVEDLTQIWNYSVNTWSENQADLCYNLLIASCREIANHPGLGKSYSGLIESLSGYKAGRHIIFYQRTAASEVTIIRILHEQMDIRNRLKEK